MYLILIKIEVYVPEHKFSLFRDVCWMHVVAYIYHHVCLTTVRRSVLHDDN